MLFNQILLFTTLVLSVKLPSDSKSALILKLRFIKSAILYHLFINTVRV